MQAECELVSCMEIMENMLSYVIIFAILLVAELLYFKVADKYNIIDKPNLRSSHTQITLLGGGIIFILEPYCMLHSTDSGIHGFC